MFTTSQKLMALALLSITVGAAAQAQAANAGQYIDDATVTTKVKAALLTDSQLKATQISVTTSQGVVQLTGNVDTKSQEDEALRVANQVDGVKSTKDMLSVRSTEEQ